MMLTRGTDENGKGALDVTFTVEKVTASVRYTGLSGNFTVAIGAKSVYGRGLCIDDLEIKSIEPIAAAFNLDGESQARLNSQLILSLEGNIDENTVVPSAIEVNGSTAAVESIERVEDGQYRLNLSEALKTDTDYTIALKGIKGLEENAPRPDSFSFHTRKTGIAAAPDGDRWSLTNYGAQAENVYVVTAQEQAITGFESITVSAGET